MRESDFCIPTSNKAVISITPSWYDRRALDTHADYALYSSLSHLANLAQSSPKVRDSLACDGGLERLIRILKEGKAKRIPERFQLSKWQQALLCVVNIGVRGSESVRNRVVEADIVPVLVTILCNALENIVLTHRQASITAKHRAHATNPPLPFSNNIFPADDATANISQSANVSSPQTLVADDTAGIAIVDNDEAANQGSRPLEQPSSFQSTRTVYPSRTQIQGLARIDDSRRTQPQVSVNLEADPPSNRFRQSSNVSDRIGPISVARQHPLSVYIDSDVNDSDLLLSGSEETTGLLPLQTVESTNRDIVDIPVAASRSVFESEMTPRLASRNQGSRIVPSVASVDAHTINAQDLAQSESDVRGNSLDVADRNPASWDQDVIWCLRLLAYLSKYPYLRPKFSRTHDVPALRQNLKFFDAQNVLATAGWSYEPMDEDLSDTLRLPFNIFQLVEKFTMRIHADESTYWAGVIMRNSCRRHEVKGGVRQCAYLECGRWEEKNKQFAKCRRCRRTKYCSKACQSKAWKGHRYWCTNTNPTDRASTGPQQDPQPLVEPI